jgi:hypothetical protein
VQYEEALFDHHLSAEDNKWDLKRLSTLRYEGDIKDYMTQKTYYNTQLGLKRPVCVAHIALDLPSWVEDCSSMNLGRTYDEEGSEEAIMVVGLRHEERQREIGPEKKLDEAGSKKNEGTGKEISTPEASSCRDDRKKSYDMGQKMTRFSDTSKSKDKDEPKWMYHNMEEVLKAVLASLLEICKEKNSASDAQNLTIGRGSAIAKSWLFLAGMLLYFRRRNERQIPLMMRVLLNRLLLRRQK